MKVFWHRSLHSIPAHNVRVVTVLVSTIGLFARVSGRRQRQVDRELVAAVQAVARSVHTGASFVQAMAEAATLVVGPVADEFAAVVDETRRGHALDGALRRMAGRLHTADGRLVAAAFAIAHAHPTGARFAFDGVVRSLRDRADIRAEVRALTAQAQASMQALVGVPIVVLVLDAVTTKMIVPFLFGSMLGRVCLVVGVSLNLVGWLWARALIARRIPS